nr:hypothetical protein CFP56_00532 [Quercus suber]
MHVNHSSLPLDSAVSARSFHPSRRPQAYSTYFPTQPPITAHLVDAFLGSTFIHLIPPLFLADLYSHAPAFDLCSETLITSVRLRSSEGGDRHLLDFHALPWHSHLMYRRDANCS